MKLSRSYAIRLAITGLLILLPGVKGSRADEISFELSSTTMTALSGGTVTFDGVITNNSGTDLFASDFFFNFFAFDASSVTPAQDLGLTLDFLIAKGNTSASVPLFDVALSSVPSGSSFPIQVQLEDINSDLSQAQTVTVSVPGGVVVSEPSTLILIAAGLFMVLFALRKRHELRSS
jgi:hypothetical protein